MSRYCISGFTRKTYDNRQQNETDELLADVPTFDHAVDRVDEELRCYCDELCGGVSACQQHPVGGAIVTRKEYGSCLARNLPL